MILNKYLKYKEKYLELKKQIGGSAFDAGPGGGGAIADAKPINFDDANRDLSSDYYISAHGREIGTFELPMNVRVIMLCAKETMTCDKTNEMRILLTGMRGFGANLDVLINNYTKNISPTIDKKNYELCVFSSNFNITNINTQLGINNNTKLKENIFNNVHRIKSLFKCDQCPNLQLTNEHINFRTGIFKVPMKYNRIYHSNHGDIKMGTIEPIDINAIQDIDNKIKGRRPLDELDEMMIYPFPPSRDSRNSEKYYSNCSNTRSIIIPDDKYYTHLPDNTKLSDLINEEFRDDGAKEPTNVMIATCRNDVIRSPIRLADGTMLPPPPQFSHEGISLTYYDKEIHEYGLKDIVPKEEENEYKFSPPFIERLRTLSERDAHMKLLCDRYLNLIRNKPIYMLTYKEFDEFIFFCKFNLI